MGIFTEDTSFELTAFHIALLKQLEFGWHEGSYDGAPTVSIKRPYGNSDVLGDIREIYAELNGLRYEDDPEEDEFEFSFVRADGTSFDAEDLDEEIWGAHRQMETVLQILARNPEGIAPGRYERSKDYFRDWKRVEDPSAVQSFDEEPPVAEAHYRIGNGKGQIPAEEIAARVYGRYVNFLEAVATDGDGDGLANGTLLEIPLSYDWLYEESLADFDRKEVVLGRTADWQPIKKIGLTEMEYWLSVKRTQDPSEVTHPKGNGVIDLEGATLMHYDGRVPTPGLRGILADLIRRGEIPRGDYLFDHSW